MMEKHITDTNTMCWKIYDVRPQSGCMLLVDMLCQAAFAVEKICRKKQKERQTDRDRITENNGCLARTDNRDIHTNQGFPLLLRKKSWTFSGIPGPPKRFFPGRFILHVHY